MNTSTGETETAIVNFEMVLGSLGNDTVTGTAGNDFIGGGFGSDVVNGGAGIDTAIYTFNPGGVDHRPRVGHVFGDVHSSPRRAARRDGFATADTLISIENVRGSASGENIYGNSGNNSSRGSPVTTCCAAAPATTR